MFGRPRVAGDASFSGQAVSFTRIHFPSRFSIDPSGIITVNWISKCSLPTEECRMSEIFQVRILLIQKTEKELEASIHKSAMTHAHYDPKINGFSGLNKEHLYVTLVNITALVFQISCRKHKDKWS